MADLNQAIDKLKTPILKSSSQPEYTSKSGTVSTNLSGTGSPILDKVIPNINNELNRLNGGVVDKSLSSGGSRNKSSSPVVVSNTGVQREVAPDDGLYNNKPFNFVEKPSATTKVTTVNPLIPVTTQEYAMSNNNPYLISIPNNELTQRRPDLASEYILKSSKGVTKSNSFFAPVPTIKENLIAGERSRQISFGLSNPGVTPPSFAKESLEGFRSQSLGYKWRALGSEASVLVVKGITGIGEYGLSASTMQVKSGKEINALGGFKVKLLPNIESTPTTKSLGIATTVGVVGTGLAGSFYLDRKAVGSLQATKNLAGALSPVSLAPKIYTPDLNARFNEAKGIRYNDGGVTKELKFAVNKEGTASRVTFSETKTLNNLPLTKGVQVTESPYVSIKPGNIDIGKRVTLSTFEARPSAITKTGLTESGEYSFTSFKAQVNSKQLLDMFRSDKTNLYNKLNIKSNYNVGGVLKQEGNVISYKAGTSKSLGRVNVETNNLLSFSRPIGRYGINVKETGKIIDITKPYSNEGGETFISGGTKQIKSFSAPTITAPTVQIQKPTFSTSISKNVPYQSSTKGSTIPAIDYAIKTETKQTTFQVQVTDTLTRQISKPTYSYSGGQVQLPKVDQVQKITPIPAITTVQVPDITGIQKQVPFVPTLPTTPITPFKYEYRPPLPPVGFGSLSDAGVGTRDIFPKGRGKYIPGYKELILGTRGRAGKTVTGLESRPIPQGFTFAYSAPKERFSFKTFIKKIIRRKK